MPPFQIIATDQASAARRGVLSTPHSEIETPCFLPVGTRGAVNGIGFDRLDEVERACRLSLDWARRSRGAYSGPGILFGIVQGGIHEDLRRESAQALVDLDFAGYAIGGVAVGEPKEAIRSVTRYAASLLPQEKARYLMGVGTPADLLESVRAGVDLFDCVLPTRNGRMGHAYTREGEETIKHERFKEELSPLDAACGCPVCRRHTRAYIRHLFVVKDFSAAMLLSLHNVFFYLDWMRQIREAIAEGRFATLEEPPEGKIEGL